jgi:gluconokinase
MNPRFLLVMGVSGSGKTSVGRALASRLGWDFYDADDFHPPENVAKMAGGIPLDDADRAPWLAALHDLIERCLAQDRPGVLACSALKDRYRRQLVKDSRGIRIVYLKGSYDLIRSRMAARPGHYMKPAMLHSQFEALEEPADALTVDIALPPDRITDFVLQSLFNKE